MPEPIVWVADEDEWQADTDPAIVGDLVARKKTEEEPDDQREES